MRSVQFTVNGEKVSIKQEDPSGTASGKAAPKAAAAPAAATSEPVATGPRKVIGKEERQVCAELGSTVVEILVKEGDEFKEGDPLLVLSAMKLETEILAPAGGTVLSIKA